MPFHLQTENRTKKTLTPLGPRQTSDFDEQYCNKAILRQSDNFCDKSNIFVTKYCYCFSKSAEIPMNWDFQFTWRKKILPEKCLFIAISLYLFIAVLLVKIARLTRALRRKIYRTFFRAEKRFLSIHGHNDGKIKAEDLNWNFLLPI